ADDGLVGKDRLLEGAIRFCKQEIPGRGVVQFAHESEVLSVGGKGDGAVDILDQDARIAAEDRGAEQDGVGFFLLIAANKVDVVSVGGEGETVIASCRGLHDFLVATGGDVPEPKGLQAFFFQRLEEVFAIGRNGSLRNKAVVGNVFDGESLEGLVLPHADKLISAVSGSDEQGQNKRENGAGAELVLLCSLHQRRAARYFRCLRRRNGTAAKNGNAGAASGHSGIGRRPAGLQFAKKALQIGAHFGSDLIAEIAVLLQKLVENALEFRRNGAVELHRRNRSSVENVSEDDGG